MRKPYRVAVWGPGNVGACAIRECALLPELRLVSVLAFSESKHGQDAGELIGIEPMGVKVTTKVADLLATKPEVVIHCPRDFGDYAADDGILVLLEAGINVITSLPYFYLKTRGEEVLERFVAAGKKGKATLFGTGVNPSVLYERLVPALLALSNGVDYVSLQESSDLSALGGEAAGLMRALGLGLDIKELDPNGMAGMVADNNFRQEVHALADKLGKKIDRIERTDFNALAPHDLEIPGMIVKKGQVGMISSRWQAICDSKPFASLQMYWYFTEAMDPKLIENGPKVYFLVDVEGRPSTRMVLELEHTFRPGGGGDHFAHAAFVSTAVTLIQAIPRVIEAEPGFMVAAMPEVHWKADLRQ